MCSVPPYTGLEELDAGDDGDVVEELQAVATAVPVMRAAASPARRLALLVMRMFLRLKMESKQSVSVARTCLVHEVRRSSAGSLRAFRAVSALGKGFAVRDWTNDAAIRRWGAFPRELLESMEPEGDFAKRHLLNPVLLRMLGDVRGRRVLDAGCGHGYLARMLAARGAQVTGVEPAQSLYDYASEKEALKPRGIRYLQADLCQLPDLGQPFDAVVASMVFMGIPDWAPAMKACVTALAPGGLFVFTIVHPCFEQLAASWRAHGEFRVREYFAEYEIPGPYASDFHRPLSAYLNELASLGCQLLELAEPALDPATAASADPGAQAYVHLPNFLVAAARAPHPTAR